MPKENTKVYAFRMTDKEKQIADKARKDAEKKLNLKLTFSNFMKFLINQCGVK